MDDPDELARIVLERAEGEHRAGWMPRRIAEAWIGYVRANHPDAPPRRLEGWRADAADLPTCWFCGGGPARYLIYGQHACGGCYDAIRNRPSSPDPEARRAT